MLNSILLVKKIFNRGKDISKLFTKETSNFFFIYQNFFLLDQKNLDIFIIYIKKILDSLLKTNFWIFMKFY